MWETWAQSLGWDDPLEEGMATHSSIVKSPSRVRLFATPWTSSLPGFSLRGILQASVLKWVAISFSRGSSQPKDQTRVSRIPGRRFNL